ncbi:cytochrome c3 family protein [Thiosocius teredinicola]|uniref:cytochrome c3 family protein n=1 Tax=Thiosocius teredinicola TaxID=1973002 RepID=UPI000990A374
MAKKSTMKLWLLWIVASLGAAGAFGYVMFEAGDKTVFMPGPLSNGHHQLADACDSCHTDPLGGGEVLQQACIDCHGEERVKPHDSHPRTKFKDPRNADRLEKINALQCVSCHVEHRPEITRKNGVTQPVDVCYHCHVDVGENRPSHVGMAFDTCANSGCHNFHNNRALYTDFLVKHMDDADLSDKPKVPLREFGSVIDEIMEYPRDHYPVEPLTLADKDAPPEFAADEEIDRDWLETAHAKAGVNCSACHQPRDAQGELTAWVDKPGVEGCNSCHNHEVARFKLGKHGMRLAADLSPMRPDMARLPMNDKAAHAELTCNSCHGGHRFDAAYAAVDACLACHNDEHSVAYEASPHAELWQAEVGGKADAGTGVSCATCHMPRIDFDVNDWMSRKLVDHNQSATLSPNSKMIRPACLHCHGLGFSIDALADQSLIDNNFTGRPSRHVESLDLARADQERYLREKAEAAQ